MTERGSASLELALGFALLVVPALVVVVAFGPWLERRELVRAAAAEGARAAVLATGDPAGAGSAVVGELAAARGLTPDEVGVRMCGGPSLPAGDGGGTCVLERGAVVVVTVTSEVAVLHTPWGTVGGVVVEATHAEPVDAYRSLP